MFGECTRDCIRAFLRIVNTAFGSRRSQRACTGSIAERSRSTLDATEYRTPLEQCVRIKGATCGSEQATERSSGSKTVISQATARDRASSPTRSTPYTRTAKALYGWVPEIEDCIASVKRP